MPAPGDNGDLPRLTVAARATGLLVAEGASIGLGAWAAGTGAGLVSYATSNVLAAPHRWRAVGAMVAGAVLAPLLAGIAVFLRRGERIDLLSRIARRSAPLCLAGLAPFLLDWHLWVGRDLTFLAMAAVFGLTLQGLLRMALATPPVLDLDLSSMRLWQRRFFVILRWRGMPLLIACLAGAFCTAYFGYYTLVNHYNLHTSAYDLAIETNLVWHAGRGGPLFYTTPLGGTLTHFGRHHTFFAYVMVPIFKLFPRPETLLVIQAIFMGAAFIPLFLIARRRVGPWIACLFTCLFALYAPFQGAVLYDFHYQPLSTFFLLMTLHLLEVRRYWWAALVIVVTLSLREDIAALLAVMAMYLVVTGRRPRAGLVVTAVAAGCFIAQKMIWMPSIDGTASFIGQYKDLLPPGENGFGGVLKTVLGNPSFTMQNFLEPEKATYILQIFAPLAFLPWRRPIGLLLFLPGFMFTLLETKYPALVSISFQYPAYWTPFVFLAAIDALAWLRRAEPASRLATVSVRSWLVAATLSMFVCSYQHGAVLQHNTAKNGYSAFIFGRNAKDTERHKDLYALIAQIPPMASVLGTEQVLPHVCTRPDAFSLRIGPFRGDYLLVGFPVTDVERQQILDLVVAGKYGVIDVRGDFVLAKEGHSTERNESLLARLRI